MALQPCVFGGNRPPMCVADRTLSTIPTSSHGADAAEAELALLARQHQNGCTIASHCGSRLHGVTRWRGLPVITRFLIVGSIVCLLCAGVVRSPEAKRGNVAGDSIDLRHGANNTAPVNDVSVGLSRSSGDGTSAGQYYRSWLLNSSKSGGGIPEPALIIVLGMSLLVVFYRAPRSSPEGSQHVAVIPRIAAPIATPIRFLDTAADRQSPVPEF